MFENFWLERRSRPFYWNFARIRGANRCGNCKNRVISSFSYDFFVKFLSLFCRFLKYFLNFHIFYVKIDFAGRLTWTCTTVAEFPAKISLECLAEAAEGCSACSAEDMGAAEGKKWRVMTPSSLCLSLSKISTRERPPNCSWLRRLRAKSVMGK